MASGIGDEVARWSAKSLFELGFVRIVYDESLKRATNRGM